MHPAWLAFHSCIAAAAGLLVATRVSTKRWLGRRPAPARAGTPKATVGELLGAVGRYAGPIAAERDFRDFHEAEGLPYDPDAPAGPLLRTRAEHLISATIGRSFARTVMGLLDDNCDLSQGEALKIVDDVALEIHNSRALLQHAIDVARDGMAVYDGHQRLVAWNRAYRAMFQLPEDLMKVGVPLHVLVKSNAERGLYGKVEESLEVTTASRLGVLKVPTVGQRIHHAPFGRVLEMRSMRLHDGGLFFTYTDATAQVASEEVLEAQNETLELRVRERTEELETLNFELAHAKAEAEDANFSKTRFLAAASHDLLQPLSAARLYSTMLTEALRRQPNSEEPLRLADNVDASLEAVEDILGALLEISQLDAGAMTAETSVFAVADLLRSLAIEFEPLASRKGLRLTTVSSSVILRSDRKLLRRLLQNLVSNAVKYTVEGRILIGIRRLRGAARIEIRDTGIGIPETKQRLIFREFERLPDAARTAPGAGLGLSIVQRLGRVLGLDVQLRSRPGEGSMFSVTIPMASETDSVARQRCSDVADARYLRGVTVAAIDNEGDILGGLDLLLRSWKCDVVCAKTLSDLKARLAQERLVPNVIIADFHAGDVNGLEIIADLRGIYGHLPSVLLTADRASTIRERAAAADVLVMHKPLKPAALRSLLSQWQRVRAATG